MIERIIFTSTLFLWLGFAAFAVEKRGVPVSLGGHGNSDACFGAGSVMGLDRNGDNFLAVRSGPAIRYQRLDRIANGQRVLICAEQGNWLGIIYSVDLSICQTGDDNTQPRAYRGPCKSGWVYKTYITIMIG